MAHPPRKTPRQARARATAEALVEAAARILEGEGRGALTTNRIAERAGASVGSLYQYFPNREAIVAALAARERGRLLAEVREAAAAGLDPRATLSAMLEAALRHQFARPRLALALEGLEQEVDQREDAAALEAALIDEVLAAVRALAPGAGPQAARDALAIARGMIDAAARAGETDPQALRPRLEAAVLGYLTWPRGAK
ncbi:helix-turn-helix domain containing protein [Albimonas sp. CAU 1670]|uniref:TetR/AcrR family transcriptional regulator n=1 Tax=Albimonas sp. CAU 1670 TaxID=3032599 RepID=UPI0023DC4CED|nr:TetR/AcrR family transcriptional regulator [Albimonas sp. CAU 1670]MDF2232478.1 helix-turn-helix domain containing protein [Albimonas sp. CAU 1670]